MSMHRNTIRLLVFDGSLRQGSHNRRLARLAAECIESNGGTVDLGTLAEFDSPSYSQDVQSNAGIPDGAQQLCRRLRECDAFVISSPEYNASVPGVLKNVIDWTSRFTPQPFNGKQCLLMSASPSMAGGNRGLWALRIPLEHLGARVYPDMFSLAQSHEAFMDNGRLKNDVLQKRFDETLRCFMDLVEAATHYPALKKQWVEFLGERPDHMTDRVETSEVAAA
jgi:NAD(P)H-dependent FMN reductase